MEEKKKNLLILVSFVVVAIFAITAVVVCMGIIPNVKHDLAKIVPVKGIKSVAYVDLTHEDPDNYQRYYEYDLNESEIKQFVDLIKKTKYKNTKRITMPVNGNLPKVNTWCYEVIYEDGTVVRFGNYHINTSKINVYYRTYTGGDDYILYGELAKFINAFPIEFNEETFHLQEELEL